jgi:phage shock protein PspC (stress-responsive transcriptional regulator)
MRGWHAFCIIDTESQKACINVNQEPSMSADNVINEIRESLNGRPGQPIVFGVCKTLANKAGKEPWIFRLAAVVLALFWMFPAVAAYIVLGFALGETEERTRKFFSGLAVIVRESVDKFFASLRDMFGPERA